MGLGEETSLRPGAALHLTVSASVHSKPRNMVSSTETLHLSRAHSSPLCRSHRMNMLYTSRLTTYLVMGSAGPREVRVLGDACAREEVGE